MHPNWFIGLPVSPPLGYNALFEGAPDGLRQFHPEDLHITVAFLGPVSPKAADEAWVAGLAAQSEPFSFSYGPLKPFGHRSRPSAWSFVPNEGRDAITAFMGRAREVMVAAAEARPDTRPPRPHITIARPPRRADASLHRAIHRWAEQVPPPPDTYRLDRLALFTWAENRKVRQFKIVYERPILPTI